jgi:hypothetical protein
LVPLAIVVVPTVTVFADAEIVHVPPKAQFWPLTVVALLVREALPILVRVFVDPEMVLFVNVSVVARATSVSVAVGSVSVPVLVIVEIVGVVSAILVALKPEGSVVDSDGNPAPLVTSTLELAADRNDVVLAPV